MIIKQGSGIPKISTCSYCGTVRSGQLGCDNSACITNDTKGSLTRVPTEPHVMTAKQMRDMFHEKEKQPGIRNRILDGISWCFVTVGSGLMIVGLWFASIGEKEAKDE